MRETNQSNMIGCFEKVRFAIYKSIIPLNIEITFYKRLTIIEIYRRKSK